MKTLLLLYTIAFAAPPAVVQTACHADDATAGLEAMVGSLLMQGFTGKAKGDPGIESMRRQAERGHVAGLVFFGHNIESPQQTRALVAYMRSWDTPRPLILALDQEGGRVSRLHPSKGFEKFPAAFDVALAGDATVYDAMAEAVADMGFDLNLAPVVDVAIRADGPAIGALGRAFGGDPATVVAWARRFVEAHRRVGVRTALKHFPGHGSATADSHHGLTDVTATWRADELVPFAALIASGHADAVMSAHVSHRVFDAEHPLSLSPAFLKSVLRDDLAYDGVLVSDALDMVALTQFYTTEEIAVMSLIAGHDLLVFSHNAAPGSARKTPYDDHAAERLHRLVTRAVADAVRTERLPCSVLRTAVCRAEKFAGTPRSRRP